MGLTRPETDLLQGVGCTLHHPSVLLDIQNIQRIQSLGVST